MWLGRGVRTVDARVALAIGAATLAACAHGIEPAAEGPAGVSSGTDGDRADSGGPSAGGNAGSAPGSGGSPGNGGGDGVGGGEMGGSGGAGPDMDAGSDADPGTGGGGAGGGGVAGSMVVDARPPVAPSAVTISAQTTPSALRTPSTGGVVYSDVCPANQALIGFKGTVDAAGGMSYLRSVQGVCATLAVTGSGTYSVTVTQAGQLSVRQAPSAVAQSVTCPSNQVIVGFGGRSGGFIDALNFRCAPLTISGTSPNFTLGFGPITATGIIGGATGGTGFADIDCGAGTVAVGQAPHAGNAIDAFGLVCAAPSLVNN